MERIIIFEAGLQDHREFYLKEISKSYELILLQPWEPSWEIPYIKEYIRCSFSNWEEELKGILKTLSTLNIKGVISLNEGTVNFANDLQRALHLPCIHKLEQPSSVRNKKAMRELLESVGLPSPRVFRDKNEIQYPVIVKPAEFMSSLGVNLVKNDEELNQALQLAKTIDIPEENLRTHYSLSNDVVIEEYIDGEEFSIECMIQNNQILDTRVTKKLKVDPPYFYETGHISNAKITNELLTAINEYANKVVSSFCLQNGLCHFEVRVKDNVVYTIELAARPGGDLIPYLYMISESLNYPDRIASVFTGKSIGSTSQASLESYAVYFPFGSSLSRKFIHEEAIQHHCKIVSEKLTDRKNTNDHSDRLGEIILSGAYHDLLNLLLTFNKKCSHVV